jgi:GTP pyrophosphokinase
MEKVEKRYSCKDWESVLASIGHGGLKEGQVANRLMEEYRRIHQKNITVEEILEEMKENPKQAKTKVSGNGIVVKGIDDVAVRFSKCCSPVPGDEIVGYITRGRGISIHRTDCVNVLSMSEADRGRLIEAEWQAEETGDSLYPTEIIIYANDRTGILNDVTKVFLEMKTDISSMVTRTSKQGIATICITFNITGVEQLNRVIAKVRNIESVIDIERTAG